MKEPHYLIISSTQMVLHDADAVAQFLKAQPEAWRTSYPEEFERLVNTGVGTFQTEHGATSIRILQVQDDGEQQPIDKPLKEES